MRNRNHYLSLISGITAIALLLTLTLGFFPTSAAAASSSEIRNQIDALKEEREAIREKIAEVKDQYEENENEILDIISRKSVLDQEIQLLYTQIDNISNQLKSYNILIADKQDELDRAQELYAKLNEDIYIITKGIPAGKLHPFCISRHPQSEIICMRPEHCSKNNLVVIGMRDDRFVRAYSQIKPDEEEKARMLSNILAAKTRESQPAEGKTVVRIHKILPALCTAAVFVFLFTVFKIQRPVQKDNRLMPNNQLAVAQKAEAPSGMRKMMNYGGRRYAFLDNGAPYTLEENLDLRSGHSLRPQRSHPRQRGRFRGHLPGVHHRRQEGRCSCSRTAAGG